MRIRVLFFGMLKQVAGAAEQSVELPEGSLVGAVFEHYAVLHPGIRGMAGRIAMARNQEFSALSAPLADGDEVAFLPPVSGGAGEYLEEIRDHGNLYALCSGPIIVRSVIDRLLRGADGAVVTFEGVARNHTAGRPARALDYDCYQPMAVRVMATIGAGIAARYQIDRIAMVHRLGRVLVGEASVLVVVTAAHRGPAFDAAREAIDTLKHLVPIWKKEYFADGEAWVEGEWHGDAPVAV
jgi:MoaE-MoaD fusion protein